MKPRGAAVAALLALGVAALAPPSAGAAPENLVGGLSPSLLDADPAGSGPDCVGPADDPQPNTPDWFRREQDNDYCGEQRFDDTAVPRPRRCSTDDFERRTGS